MSLDFRGGYAEVVIFKEGLRFDKSNFPELFNSITEVRAKSRSKEAADITVVVSPSFLDGLKILQSGLLGTGLSRTGQKPPATATPDNQQKKELPAKSIEDSVSNPKQATNTSGSSLLASNLPYMAVRFSYPDQLDNDGLPAETIWYSGMMGIPELELHGNEIGLTLKAYGYMTFLGSLEGPIVFRNEPMIDAINRLASPLGLTVTFDEGDSQTADLLSRKKVTGCFNEAKLTTIRTILFQADCDFIHLTGEGSEAKNELRVKSRKAIADGKIDFTFVLYRQIDPTNNVIPMTNFQLRSPGNLFMAGSAFGSFQRTIDPSTKKVDKIFFKPEDFDGTTLNNNNSGGGALPSDTGTGAEMKGGVGIKDASDPNLAGRSDMTLARDGVTNKDEIQSSSKAQLAAFWTADIELPGLPRLRPLTVAQVIVGDNVPGLSGPGQVNSVEHVWDSNGWSSHIEFRQQGNFSTADKIGNFKAKASVPQKIKSDKNDKAPTSVAARPANPLGGVLGKGS